MSSAPAATIAAPPKSVEEALEQFEAACFQRRQAEALRLIAQVVEKLVTTARGEPAAGAASAAPDRLARQATRIVSALFALLLDPAAKIGEDLIRTLAPWLADLRRLVLISGFGDADHAVGLLDQTFESARDARQAIAHRRRLQLLLSLDSAPERELSDFTDHDPTTGLLLLLSHLGTKPLTTAMGQERRERLLEFAERLRPAPLPDTPDHITMLASAWMGCSYASGPRKHAIKPRLNAIIRDLAARRGLADLPMPAERAQPERPLMLVVAERIHTNHVQYRYFGQWLRQLRQRFELALVAEAREIDARLRALFDEVVEIERDSRSRFLHQVVDYAARRRPDVAFYPSVGMRYWGVVLANLRLAPIQFTALGHSASTFCPTIDYYAIERGYVGAPELFGEKLIVLEDSDLFFERSPHYQRVEPLLRERPQVVRIAIAANLLKLNPHFLAVCSLIARRAKRPVEFHVFPDVRGVDLQAARRYIPRILPRATVHPMIPYVEYIRRLNACDLSLSPWPFGGLHSVVDVLRQGVPVVAMEGLEPHARTDSVVLRRVGMPDWLVCRDEESYVATALRVIEDDALRLDLSRHALACEIDRRLFGDGSTPLDHGILDSIWAMYRHHEHLQADPRRAFDRADLAALG